MSIVVPVTLDECLADDVVVALNDALSPPREERAGGNLEIEIESSEGTFTLRYTDGDMVATAGFADEDPFLSVEIPSGGFGLLQRELQAACDGFPQAPALAERLDVVRGFKRSEIEATLEALWSVDDAIVVFHVSGVGVFRVARGPIDEATREISISINGEWVDSILAGAPLDTFGDIKVKGDRRLSGELVSVFGEVWLKLKRGQ